MAERPPVFRPPGWRPREPWERRVTYQDRRVRGRAGQRMRALVLAEEPYCRMCLAEGLRVQATVVDHIVPLAAGGDNSRGNQQALCVPHHEAKSLQERVEARHGPGGGSIFGG